MINVPMNPRNTKRTAPPKQMGSLVRLFLGFRLDPYTRISLEGHDAFGVLYRFCHIQGVSHQIGSLLALNYDFRY